MIAIFYMTQAQADNLQGRMVQILFTLPCYDTLRDIGNIVSLRYNLVV